ncbi:MAG: hypothetical protein WAK55_18235 [Xanthobacteraceae bacterium]
MSEQSQQLYDRLEELKALAAETLKLPIEHDDVQLLAGLKLQYEHQLSVLVGGGKIDPTDLVNLAETIKRITPPVLPTVTLNIVRGRVDVCPCCGYTRPTEHPEPPPPERKPPMMELRAEALDAPAPTRQPVALPPPKDSISEFHNALPDGTRAPIKRTAYDADGNPIAVAPRGGDRGLCW